MPDKSGRFVRGATRSLQKSLDRAEPVIFASYGIVGAILLLGGAGYLVDRWLETLPWFSVAGASVGLSVAFYALITAARRR
jgi:F0F1-type ATP synthase assembly protein I